MTSWWYGDPSTNCSTSSSINCSTDSSISSSSGSSTHLSTNSSTNSSSSTYIASSTEAINNTHVNTILTHNAPARNAPNGGKNIKALIDQKPTHITLITDVEIKKVLNTLRKTEHIVFPPLPQQPSVLLELNNVFGNGKDRYFELVRKRREETNIQQRLKLQKQLFENKPELISVPKVACNPEATGKLQISDFEFISDSDTQQISLNPKIDKSLLMIKFNQEDIGIEVEQFENI